LAHLIYIEANFSDLDPKRFANQIIKYFYKNDINIQDFYYGSYITQDLYIYFHQLMGKLYPLKEKLQKKLQKEIHNPIGIIRALALTSLYGKHFEESYSLFNTLIDKYKQRDSEMLFLAAVASMSADHKANAIALLELSKLKNNRNKESRYGLALLYMEVKNYSAANIQLSRIKNDSRFRSKFFDFSVDNREIKD